MITANSSQVKPFTQLFKGSLALKAVFIFGITDKATTRRLRQGLLPTGGLFEVYNRPDSDGPWMLELEGESNEE